MEVSGIGMGLDLQKMQEMMQVGQQMRTQMEGIFQEAAGDVGVSLDISEPGKGFSVMMSLLETEPEKFKELMNNIADKLTEAAEEAEGPQQQFLADLAERFRETAETGDLSNLPRPGEGMHGKPGMYAPNGEAVTPLEGTGIDEEEIWSMIIQAMDEIEQNNG
ncbi:MAG: hypothetical protein KJ970_17210 [Candidatus Eisenbacteria bacterium]|uniref:Uncharacterized protein n=1 Tax=Eiseniibacteriota bacterium TaxID=2212470 RepID=A0A948RZT7_UNCEI|nr:hypothetical protein [Candidatus Eisenbacteria bacterium]MBU1948684.1 hypothetical protein [Candidatus Eisenbacteria bacterium]MBU2692657.1 hypothetical protein [Candidatus Eisenbacteria bacterium]